MEIVYQIVVECRLMEKSLTLQEIRSFIVGRSDSATNKKILDDLEKTDSFVRKVLDGMALAAKTMLQDALRQGVSRSMEDQSKLDAFHKVLDSTV